MVRELLDRFKALELQYQAIEQRLADLEADDEPQVVDVKSPLEVMRAGEPDEDSAIVQPKSPQDIRRERERREQEDIARSA